MWGRNVHANLLERKARRNKVKHGERAGNAANCGDARDGSLGSECCERGPLEARRGLGTTEKGRQHIKHTKG